MTSVLRTQPRRLFADFLALAVSAGADARTVQTAADETIRWLKGGEPIAGGLLDRWYRGLANGLCDFEVYGEDAYLGDLWAGWAYYCRKYLLALEAKVFSGVCPLTVVDVGCGFGYSTLALRELFPVARVYGTNLEGLQTRMARALGVEIRAEINGDVDLVFASEYFEHFEEPIAHLDSILAHDPAMLVAASSFGARSIGHFDVYMDGTEKLGPKAISRRFNDRLRERGYRKVVTGLWNNRPAVWRRD